MVVMRERCKTLTDVPERRVTGPHIMAVPSGTIGFLTTWVTALDYACDIPNESRSNLPL